MERLKSRKLWITVLAGALVTIGEEIGIDLDPEQLISLGLVVASYLGGQAFVDKAKVQAEVSAGVEALRHEANAIIAALTAKLEEVQAAPPVEAPDADLHQG